MTAWLSALAALLKLVPFLANWLEKRAETQRAAELADAALAKEEARASRGTAGIMAEHRLPNAGVDRLRDGTF